MLSHARKVIVVLEDSDEDFDTLMMAVNSAGLTHEIRRVRREIARAKMQQSVVAKK